MLYVPIAKQFLMEIETRTKFNEQKLIYFYFIFTLSSTELRFINIGLEWESRELLLHCINKEKDKIELQVNIKCDVDLFGI